MKKLFLLAAVLLGSLAPLLAACAPPQIPEIEITPMAAPMAGRPAPDFELGTDGKKLSDLHGQVVLINFWASWCPPCKEEMPVLEAAYRKYQDQGFVVLGVNVGEEPRVARAFHQEHGLTFPIVFDKDGSILRSYWLASHPASFFVDREGRIFKPAILSGSRYSGFLGPLTEEVLEEILAEMGLK